MQFQDITTEIDFIENQFLVNDWKVEGFHIWPILRISIRNQLLYKFNQNTYNEGVIGKRTGLVTYAVSALKSVFYTYQSIINDFRKNDKIRGKYDVLFHTVIQDRVLIDGTYYNRLCDPIIDQLKNQRLRTMVFESSPLPIRHKYPRFSKTKYIQHYLTWSRVRSYVKLRLFGRSNFSASLSGYEQLKEYLFNKYEISIWNIGKINEQTDLLFSLKNFYRKLIQKTSAKLAIITMYYSVDGMAFVLACKEEGLIVCDMQHGVQGDYHVAYGLWNKVPEKGYAVLPRYFLCWSDYEAKAIEKWNSSVRSFHSPVIIGNPFIKKWKNENDLHVVHYDKIIKEIKVKSPGSRHILYTLQDYSIPEWLINAISESADNCFWWIRMHPEQIQYSSITTKLLNDAGIANFNLADASVLPLYALLRNMDIHVTAWSTTILEALEFDIPSIIVDKLGEEMFSNELSKGSAITAYSEYQLLNGINELSDNKKIIHSVSQQGFVNQFEEILNEIFL
jgi:hypothetical protein